MKPFRLTAAKTAELLGVSVSTLRRRYTKNADFPQPMKDGLSNTSLYFITADVEAYIESKSNNNRSKISSVG